MLASHSLMTEGLRDTVTQSVRELHEADRREVMALFAEDQLHSVHLRSFVEDNGFAHPSNRGRFFGYFEDGHLLGVALLGHAVLCYARPEVEQEALAFFAQVVTDSNISCHVVFGPQAQVETFWAHLARHGFETSQVREMNWYVCQKPVLPLEGLQLRRANQEELAAVVEAHAEMFREATGKDPRDTDPEGFVRRTAERIERRRTWISLADNQVTFKTELQSLSPEVAYLEGIWVHQDYRGQKIARNCLNELLHRLLKQQLMVCLTTEAADEAANSLYRQVGFIQTEKYQARYLRQRR